MKLTQGLKVLTKICNQLQISEIYKNSHHHHHHVVPLARISLTLSRHFSLSFIASGRSSGLHPVSSQSCWMYVRGGRPAFARPCVGVHKSTSFMSSSLLLQQCPACLVRLTCIVFRMGGRWPYSWCLLFRKCFIDVFLVLQSLLQIYINIIWYCLCRRSFLVKFEGIIEMFFFFFEIQGKFCLGSFKF